MLEKIFPNISNFYLLNTKGRKKKNESSATVPIYLTIRLSEESNNKINSISKIEHREPSVIARALLLQALDKIKID